MDIQTFIQNFREAFGEKAELPLVFWYSDTQEGTCLLYTSDAADE